MATADKPRILAIVQARMGSTRLPGKAMLPLAGEPMLVRVVRRAQRSKALEAVIVATTTSPRDDVIADLCAERGWAYERGSEDDVLDRYYRAARTNGAALVVRITSDCPLVDPEVIDEVVAVHRRSQCDYASNTIEPRTFPRGLDVEVFSFTALERAWREDDMPARREHVTPYIYRNPAAFRLCRVAHPSDLSFHRWTVDTPEDYELMQKIFDSFGRDDFRWSEVLLLLDRNPDWLAINRDVKQRTVP